MPKIEAKAIKKQTIKTSNKKGLPFERIRLSKWQIFLRKMTNAHIIVQT